MHTQYTYKYWDQSLYFWRTYKNVEVYNGFAFHVAVSLTGTGLTLIKHLHTHYEGVILLHTALDARNKHTVKKIVTHSNGRTLLSNSMIMFLFIFFLNISLKSININRWQHLLLSQYKKGGSSTLGYNIKNSRQTLYDTATQTVTGGFTLRKKYPWLNQRK